MELLAIDLPTVAQALATARTSLATEYAELERSDGTPVSPHRDNNLLYPIGNALARLVHTLMIQMRETASQATPFGAAGGALHRSLSGK